VLTSIQKAVVTRITRQVTVKKGQRIKRKIGHAEEEINEARDKMARMDLDTNADSS
jgi:hypothetical protein